MLLGTHQRLRNVIQKSIQQHWKKVTANVLSLLICGSMLSGAILPTLAQQNDTNTSQVSSNTSGTESLNITMKDLGNPDGYTLKTVRTERRYFFTKPKGWKILPSSSVHVAFQHSPSLLAERSALNILVNDRIIKTIRLEDANIQPTEMDIPIPSEIMKDNNSLTFQVDQHYTYDCEDPFSEELWTTILDETRMRLDFQRLPVEPDLAQFPYPHLDELNNYEPTRIGYLLPNNGSDESLNAMVTVAAFIGQKASWREIEPYVADSGDLSSYDNLILVGTPSENNAISSVSGAFDDVRLSGSQFTDSNGSVLPDNVGVLQLVRNPRQPASAILVVSGNGPEGVKNAAKVLASNPSNKLLAGSSAIIREYNPGEGHPYRAWKGFVQRSGDSFHELGMPTQTARGITSLPVFYKLKLMPDLFMGGKKKARVKAVYSYASQLAPDQSKLEVLLNGKALKSIALDDPKGKNLAEFTFDIPTEELFNFNDLEFKFHLYPDKYDVCRFTTDVHIWGTIHDTTTIDIPGEIKSAVPDVGLINDGGYPFTGYQDLSQVSVIMPEQPNTNDYNLMLQVMSRLGRESQSARGINVSAYHANSIDGDARANNHLLIIGGKTRNGILAEFDSKLHLLTDSTGKTLKGVDAKLAQLEYNAEQGIIEELMSPWNKQRVAMVLTSESETGLAYISKLFQTDRWFSMIKPGNIAVVNGDGPKSLIVMKQGDARFLLPNDFKEGFKIPMWGWIILGFLAVMGFFSVLRFLFGK